MPLLEGQLKEKRGKWKFLKRWHTKYFTLSSAALTCSDQTYNVSAFLETNVFQATFRFETICEISSLLELKILIVVSRFKKFWM